MIKAEQVPDDCADEVLLRLESAKPGAETSRSFAKLIVANAINAWPGMETSKPDSWSLPDRIILPLTENQNDKT